MSPNERELLRLQVLLSLWPSGAGREEFKSELHLKGALQEVYDKMFPGGKYHPSNPVSNHHTPYMETCPYCEGTGEGGLGPDGITQRLCEECLGSGHT